MTLWHYLSLKFRSLRSQKQLVLLSPAAPDVIGGRGWRNVLMRWQNSARSRGWGSIYRRVEDGRGGLGHAATPRFPSPLIKPDVRIGRVAQPLLAFAPTDPIVRRYRNGLFRTDLRRMNHPCHA